MMNRQMTGEMLEGYRIYLGQEEKAAGTIEKYLRDIRGFADWLSGREVTKESVIRWKTLLLESGYAARTVNSMLSALNGLFSFLGWEDCRMKFLKIQRQMFRDERKDMNLQEYRRLVKTAYRSGKRRLGLAIETICGSGIRVSELAYITVEAAKKGRSEIMLKGKARIILLSDRLCRKLLEYAGKENIKSGKIFLTRNGNSLSRRQIWSEMKGLCAAADVEMSKVFPHNLRHLFAKIFYQNNRDIVKLADILGHTSIDTTRIYLLATGTEHIRQLNRLRLIS